MKESLLLNYIQHRCSVNERLEVRKWLAESAENRNTLTEMEKVYTLMIESKYSEEKRLESAYSQLKDQINLKDQVRLEKKYSTSKILSLNKLGKTVWFKYAASIVVIISLSLNLFFVGKSEDDAFTTIFVPTGQRVSLVMSDGSKVWLNSESRFVYPNQFSSQKRQVELDGEGYFEIAKNEESPFIVKLPALSIRVLGTKFNAKGYEGEPSTVSLKEGAVEVSTNDCLQHQLMRPNDMVYYTQRDGLVLLRNKAVPQMDSWTTGDLRFDNQKLEFVVKAIERKYDVKIRIVDAQLSEELFTCHFRKDLNLLQALDLLRATNLLDYKIKDSVIYFYKRKN